MKYTAIAAACATLLFGGVVLASSHREAPNISRAPKVDGTDLYIFRSYETGRSGFVTILANYDPLQDAYGGPNYFPLDTQAHYNIAIDNDGDGRADITYQFRMFNGYRGITIPVGGQPIAIPLNNIGPFSSSASPNLNFVESYRVYEYRDGVALPTLGMNTLTGNNTFIKPHDNIGNKSIADYARYANKYISTVKFGTCATDARVFVGQRNEGFAVNLGEIFDLINTNPVGPPNGERNIIADKNITTIALEIPIQCLTQGSDPIIGAWTTATVPNDDGTTFRQVSRLSAPLVNEVVIGLPAKDEFNASRPYDDAQFGKYVTNPTLPEIIQALFPSVTAPNSFPRNDLVAAFLTGIAGLNQPAGVRPAEMMRLNTSIPAKTAVNQQTLGVLAGDTAGFPNGRRPGDDVVDIELRVMMGALLTDAEAPSRNLPYTDGAAVKATDFRNTFPYLNTPIPGSPSN